MASSSGKALENWSPATTPRRIFSLRIVNLDYYMAPPLPGMDVCSSEFQGRGVREVPVVRIFGSTTSGQKTCLHLHKAFPYFYVPYDSELPQEVNEALAFVRRLASSIEKAMKMASTVGAKRQHLHSCSFVRGKRFYGYHPNEQLFIKLVLYYPQEVSRLSTLLLSGGIMNHKFQPHEAHFPYLLQILIDHNLCGMGHIHLSSLKFRNPLPEAPMDMTSLVKRIRKEFTYQEAILQVEGPAGDPSNYCSPRESIGKEKTVSNSPLWSQQMKAASSEHTVSTLPASGSSSPAFHQMVIKGETLSNLPCCSFPPTIPLTKIKEEPLDILPLSQSSSPAYHQTMMKEGPSREFPLYTSSSPALHPTTIKEEVVSSLLPSRSSSPAYYQTTIKEDTRSTLPASKPSSPAIYQLTSEGGSQPEMWLQKSVPGDWIWPLIASENIESAVQEPSLYSRQSTCELEADASVEDILNRGELLFLPLQQAGPEIKMVQSLTTMWEEERGRSGNGGPAGSVDPLPTPRVVQIPSPFEDVMRETLFQIARAEEEELVTKDGSQSSTQKSNSGSGTERVLEICTLMGSQQELKVSLGSADNSAAASDENETGGRQQSSVPLEIDPNARAGLRLESSQTRHDLATAINEEIIRKQLSQRCLSQDLDKEVAEFLRWMGTTQLDTDDQEDSDNKHGEMAQLAFSQMFSSPGMDAALLKALADYENDTEQECQAILDCADLMDEGEQDAVNQNHINKSSHERAHMEIAEENEKAYRSPSGRHQFHESGTKNDGNGAQSYIPQTDGAGDDEQLEGVDDRTLQSFSSKRRRHDRKDSSVPAISKHVSARSGFEEQSKEQHREVSLRDMMRKRRERKPGRKESLFPSSSTIEGGSSEVEPDLPKDNGGTLPIYDEKYESFEGRNMPQDQTTRVVVGKNSPQSEDLLATTRRGMSVERHITYRTKGKIIQKSEDVKFRTLPVVTLKYDGADINCCIEQLSEKYSKEGCGPSCRGSEGVNESGNIVERAPQSSSQKSDGKRFIQKGVTVGEDIAETQSRGDDRDCGGGPTPFGLYQDSLMETAPFRVLAVHVNSPSKDKGIKLDELDDNHADYEPEADSRNEYDFVVAETQLPRKSNPQPPHSSQLRSGSWQVDAAKHDSVDISSQGHEALLMSQVPKSIVPELTTQNHIEPCEGREERVVPDGAYKDNDCFRQVQCVKPDVSYMTEVRPDEVEKDRDNVQVDIQGEDVVPEERTQILTPFIPFLDSREPGVSRAHTAEMQELGIAVEDDQATGQTQVLELDNLNSSDVPRTMFIELVRDLIESDGVDVDDEFLRQTQVLNLEKHQMITSLPWKSGAYQEEVRECYMADDNGELERPASALAVCSSPHPELYPRESCGYVERVDILDGNGATYEQTQKMEPAMPQPDEFLPLARARYAEAVKEDDTSEESCDYAVQTQILTPEEGLPLTPDRGKPSEIFASRKVDDISATRIKKALSFQNAEIISSPSPGFPVKTVEVPQKLCLLRRLHGVSEFREGSSPAFVTGTLEGANQQGNNRTQYLLCDMSDDSEASYDSEENRRCRDEGVTSAALFEDQEIGGSPYCQDGQVEGECVSRDDGFSDAPGRSKYAEEAKSATTFRDKRKYPVVEEMGGPSGADEHVEQGAGRLANRWENAEEKIITLVSEAQRKNQEVEPMGGPSAADEGAENLGSPKPRGIHPTQYLFTDMSDDSEASYNSGSDGRDFSWSAADELFAEEVEDVGLPVAAEGGPYVSQAERNSSRTMTESEDYRGMSKEQNCSGIITQKPLLMDVSRVSEGQIFDPVIAENSNSKALFDYPCITFPAVKVSDDGTRKSEIISESSGRGTDRALVFLPGSSFGSPSPYSENPSTSKKHGSSHVSAGELRSLAVSCLESSDDENRKVIMEDNDLHVFGEGCSYNSRQKLEEVGKEYDVRGTEGMQLQRQCHTPFVASQGEATDLPDCKSALVPLPKHKADQQLLPLIFHQRPPTRERIAESFKEILCNYKEDDVFYGNVKDVSDHPVVRAGLIFDVRSREAVHLKSFQFGGLNRRSNFYTGSKHRMYIQQEGWGGAERIDGIPAVIENYGTVLYTLTPARAPPSPIAVKQWLSEQSVQHMETSKRTPAGGQQIFTMDPNTGKLVPVVEIGSVVNTQESTPKTDSSQEDGDFVRPASPKYDERHIFFSSHSATASSFHGFSSRKSAPKDENRSGNIPSSSPPREQGTKSSDSLPPLAVSSAQTLPPLSISDGKGLLQKIPVSALPLDSGVKALVIRKLVENATKSGGKQYRDVSQMTALTAATTPLSQSGFRDPASSGLGQQITLMSIEVFAETRGELLPDPRYDAIGCIVLVLHEDGGKASQADTTVVLVRDKEAHCSRRYPDGIQGCELIYLPDEKALFKCFAQLVRICDPDMVVGWEVQGLSLGLLAERAANLGISLLKQLSRIPPVPTASSELFGKEAGDEDPSEAALFDRVPVETIGVDEPIIDDEWGRTHGSGLYIGGRTVLNAWRIMRGELKLNIYSIEAVAEAVLRRRVPRLPWQTLTRCFMRGPSGGRYQCIQYFIYRARLTLEIMEQLDLINRTAELARVFGIDFYSVFSRGSQFRVESMMARLAHTQNYLLVSPTRQQVAEQPGMQCLPLVMEPESRFYNSPVIVLDFQSLYPSMIIAYNLCFSTCLGKLSAENPKVLGVTKLKLDPGVLSRLKESVTISPNGVMFAPKEVLPGVLPRLLQEILSTRIMVKKAMKALTPEQRVLERVLNARQFALKLIANVTYGYTAAGFSGRMPCAEIADSIVQCGRLTLERAINMVNSNPRWNARVVYGDTDSMFVLCEGRSKDEAFKIGQEIAASVTAANPPPVTLKMEKVYLPCVLLTKKRYVGYSFESPSQVKPIFDAKGIETIRRDTCPAVAKAVEHSLRILFETQDLSQVKQYLQRQWGKILSGRISVQDFVFAKEVRLGTYSARSPVLPPAAIVASKAMAVDPRAEPRYAERIPYVVVHGEPGARLVDMVVDPLTLISQPSLRLHDTYYITKQIIPACQRIFMLVGADLRAWFSEMPRVYRPPTSKRVSNLVMGAKSTKWDSDAGKIKRTQNLRHGTIDQYFLSRHCTICGEFTRASQLLCGKCITSPRAAAVLLPGRTARLEKEYKHLEAICRHCGGDDPSAERAIACISLDCSVFFERRKVHRELIAAGAVSSDLGYYPPCLPELF